MSPRITALVLAGDRGPTDPLIQATGVSAKALTPIRGEAMILRVLRALRESDHIGRVVACGPHESALQSEASLAEAVATGTVEWIPPAGSLSLSVLEGLEAAGVDDAPVLVTTADHAMLESTVVDEFVARALDVDADVVFGTARYSEVKSAHPDLPKTKHRLQSDAWCGCNLFMFRTGRGRRAARFWRRVETERKRPWRIARIIGLGFLLRFLLRRMTLEEAAERIGQRMDVVVRPVILRSPDAAVDVDSDADRRYVEELLRRRAEDSA